MASGEIPDEMLPDFSSFPADAAVVVNDIPYISQLPNDGSSKLRWVPASNNKDAPEQLVVRTKLRMMGAMLIDHPRNIAYDEALRQCVREGDIVLDAGSGTGLLSMLAAKHKARRVYACEMNDYFAEISRRIIKDNELDNVVNIIAKRTSEITVQTDFDNAEPVDVIVTETMDSVLTTEGIIQTLRDAKKRLAKPGVRVVPQSGTMYGRLVTFRDNSHWKNSAWLDDCDSIDLNSQPLLLHGNSPHFLRDAEFISEDRQLLSIRFGSDSEDEGLLEESIEFTDEAASSADGLLMWWSVNLYGDIVLSTNPDSDMWQDHWHHALFLFDKNDFTEKQPHLTVLVSLDPLEGKVSVRRQFPSVQPKSKELRKERLLPLNLSPSARYSFEKWTNGPMQESSAAFLSTHPDAHVIDLSGSGASLKSALGISTPTFRIATSETSTLAIFCPAVDTTHAMLLENELDAAMTCLYRCVNKLPATGAVSTMPTSAIVKAVTIDFNDLKNPRLHLESVMEFKHAKELFKCWNPNKSWTFPLALYNYDFTCSSDEIVVATIGFNTMELQLSQSNARLQTRKANAVVFWVEWYFPNGQVQCLASPLNRDNLDLFAFCQVQFLEQEIVSDAQLEICGSLSPITNRLEFAVTIVSATD